MAITVEGIRNLINVPDISDETIQWYIDNGYTNPLSICIALCDYMASLVSNDTDIKVGPISLSGSDAAKAWNLLKKDFILRLNTGSGWFRIWLRVWCWWYHINWSGYATCYSAWTV